MGKKGRPICPRPPETVFLLGEDPGRQGAIEEEALAVQQRLRNQLQQLWTEHALFLKLMYKNKNQHRRCLYFRKLMQVRRDLNLLQALGLNQIVQGSSLYFSTCGRATGLRFEVSSEQKFTLSQQGKMKKTLQQLQGAARLLEQMADPVLKASLGIAGLLGSAFFMPFALTVFALLARFRVLLVQIMYDVVCLYNLLAATCRDRMVWRGPLGQVPAVLECHWQNNHFKLVERVLPSTPEDDAVKPQPEDSDRPSLPWVIDDKSGKIIDLQKAQDDGGSPFGSAVMTGTLPPEALEGAEKLQADGECIREQALTVVDEHPPTLVDEHPPTLVDEHPPTLVDEHPPTLVDDDKGLELLDPVGLSPKRESPVNTTAVNLHEREEQGVLDPGTNLTARQPTETVPCLPSRPQATGKREGGELESGQPNKRVAYLSVQATSQQASRETPTSVAVPQTSVRQNPQQIFEMLLGRSVKKSMFN